MPMRDSERYLHDLYASLAESSPNPPSMPADPCARLTVTPVAGGMRDAPIVQHAMAMRKNPACSHLGPCKHTPRHNQVYLPDHRETHGICKCPPVDVPAHYEYVRGTRSKGTVTHPKRKPADRAYAGSGTALGKHSAPVSDADLMKAPAIAEERAARGYAAARTYVTIGRDDNMIACQECVQTIRADQAHGHAACSTQYPCIECGKPALYTRAYPVKES